MSQPVAAFFAFGLSGETRCNDDGTWSVTWTIDADAEVDADAYSNHLFSVFEPTGLYPAGWFPMAQEVSRSETFANSRESAEETVRLLIQPPDGGGPYGSNVVEQRSVSRPTGCTPSSPTLTLNKRVASGDASPGSWTLSADGPTPFSGTSGVSSPVEPGTYTLTESGGPDGYTLTSLTCDNAPGTNVDSVTLATGDQVTCTFTNTADPDPDPDPPELLLVKEVVNDDGGTAQPDDWTLTAVGYDPDEPQPGTYPITETGPGGYELTSLTCSNATGQVTTVTLTAGEAVTCTFVNDDIAPPELATLTLLKQVVGGDATPDDWTLNATGPTPFSGSSGISSQVDPGTYTITETGGPDGYTLTSLTCPGKPAVSTTNPTLTLEPGDTITCTYVNSADDETILTLVKDVVNDNGGTAAPDDWTLEADGPTPFSGASGVSAQVDPGTYTLSETGPADYTLTSLTCDNAPGTNVDSVTLAAGDQVTCTFTNDDIAPPVATLTLTKVVVGGDATPDDWTLRADGPTPISGTVPQTVDAGTYTLTETPNPDPNPITDGYTLTSLTCSDEPDTEVTTVTLEPGDDITCTFTNTAGGTVLTLIKEVDNDNGGTAEPGDWTLRADGPTPISGTGTVTATVEPGTYTLTETGPDGYELALDCPGDRDGNPNDSTVTLTTGDDIECTFTNDDIAPTLTLTKVVVGGDATPDDWTLRADGPTPISGTVPQTVDAGTYTLTETPNPDPNPITDGYTLTSLTCSDEPDTEVTTVTLEPGDDITCAFTNSFNPLATLTLNKVVVYDDGGEERTGDWLLEATGPTPFSGSGDATEEVEPGTYTLSETGPDGYELTSLICPGKPEVSVTTPIVTLESGDTITCTFTNNDIAPKLTLVKVVVNDDLGMATAQEWRLTADGPTLLTGRAVVTGDVEVGSYELSESGPAGYTPRVTCDDNPGAVVTSVTLRPGDDVTCWFRNDDEPPARLTVIKLVENDHGGDARASDWTLDVAGVTATNGTGRISNLHHPGPYVLSESGGPPGYEPTDFECETADGRPVPTEALATPAGAHRIILSAGADVTCTVTNIQVEPARLRLEKIVVGGPAVPTDWNLSATGPTPFSGRSGVEQAVVPGTYQLVESDGPRLSNGAYQPQRWSCRGGDLSGDEVTLVPGETARCSITNTFVVQGGIGPLTLVKRVEGGTRSADEWTLRADGPIDNDRRTPISGAGTAVSPPATDAFLAGTYVLSESGPDDYRPGEWECEGGAQDGDRVTVRQNEPVTCTITNTFVPPDTSPGIQIESAQPICSELTPHVSFVMTGTLAESDVVSVSLFDVEGNLVRSVTVDGLDGWVLYPGASVEPLDWPGWTRAPDGGWVEDASDRTLANGGKFVVELNGDEVDSASFAAIPDSCGGPPRVDVRNECRNGIPHLRYTIPTEADFATLTLTDIDGNAGNQFADVPPLGAVVYPGASVEPRDWPGWAQNDDGDWVADPSDARLADGGILTVEIDDQVFDQVAYPATRCGPPGPPLPSVPLTLVVQVSVDVETTADGWTLIADGAGGNDLKQVGPGSASSSTLKPDVFEIRATGPDGETGDVMCNGDPLDDGLLDLTGGGDATCTLTVEPTPPPPTTTTTTPPPPILTLAAFVEHGLDVPTDVTLTAVGPATLSGSTGVSSEVSAGTYQLSASGTEGFDDLGWDCEGASSNASTVTLGDGDAAVTCTLTLRPPTLMIDVVVRGDEPATSWTLSADGPTAISGAGNVSAAVLPGDYQLSHAGPSEYLPVGWSCDGGQLDGASLTVDDDTTCTLTSRITRPEVIAALADNESAVCSREADHLEYEVILINEWSEPVSFELFLVGIPDELRFAPDAHSLVNMEGTISVDDDGNTTNTARIQPTGSRSGVAKWTVKLDIPDDRSELDLFNVQLALDLLDPDPTQVALRVDRRNLREPTSLSSCPAIEASNGDAGAAGVSAAEQRREP